VEWSRSEPQARSVNAAVRTAVLAAAAGISQGRAMAQQATRRVADESAQFNPAFGPAPDSEVWGASSGMTIHLADGWADRRAVRSAPEMKENGLFTRDRLSKYRLGSSAFRLGDEAAARPCWSAIRAQRAAVATDNQTSSRRDWRGSYHGRGDDATARGDLPAALADYQFAFNLIQPKENSDAANNKTAAAFRAGRMELRLGQPERAAQWYQQGITLSEGWHRQAAA
jgi:tetratricopeptide (TPR) repeat protein